MPFNSTLVRLKEARGQDSVMSNECSPAKIAFQHWKRTLKNAEADYADGCMIVFRMAVEFGTLYEIDLEEELPALPHTVTVRQGYMIRQTCFDFAIGLEQG